LNRQKCQNKAGRISVQLRDQCRKKRTPVRPRRQVQVEIGPAITFFLFTLNRFADCSNWQEQFDATAVHAFFRNVKTLVFSFQLIEIVSPAVTWSVASKLASG